MASKQDRRCYRRFIRSSLPFFFLFQPFYGFNWNRGWRAGEWEIFFSCWPCGTSFIGSRLCRRIGHSAYLKCIVARCAGGYVSVNVTELQCRRKIVFHTEIPMDPTPVSSLKIASGLFVEPRTINFFKNSFITLEFSLSFFFLFDVQFTSRKIRFVTRNVESSSPDFSFKKN